MSRSLGVVCAGALLMATAGCTLDSFFLSFSGSSSRQEKTVPVALDQVKVSLRTTLSKSFGILAEESRNGEEVWLKGQTNTGKKFAFILQRQKSEFGERTVVAFEGEKETSDLLWLSVVAAFTSPPPQPQTGNVTPVGNYVPNQNLSGATQPTNFSR